jgi:hypothetical protein
MNKTEQQKVRNFLSDEIMANAVRGVLLQSFIKKRDRSDVNVIAAERIAIDLLEDAWKDLEKLRSKAEVEKRELTQVGL